MKLKKRNLLGLHPWDDVMWGHMYTRQRRARDIRRASARPAAAAARASSARQGGAGPGQGLD
jgi:hypothetical protein